MKSSQYWIDGLATFFREVENKLPVILDAAGCREGWLQAEAFHYFRSRGDACYVNTEKIAPRQKADISAYAGHDDEAPLWMIGETKVFGTCGYQEKILGLPVKPLDARVAQGERSIVLKPPKRSLGWGLVPDYCRLRDFRPGEPLVRLLVLVLDRRAQEPDRLGRVLLSVDFDPKAIVLHEADSFIAKCWTVGRAP